jgi:hypothetical protein
MKIKNELERQREIEEMRMDKWRTDSIYFPHDLNTHDPHEHVRMGKTCTRLGLGTASTRRAWFIHRHLLPSLFGAVIGGLKVKRAVLRRKHRARKKLTYMYLKLNRSTKMKDSNDAQTIDWVDEVELTENERKFLENREARDTCANLFTLARNLPHSVALNNLIDRTINDLLTKEQQS